MLLWLNSCVFPYNLNLTRFHIDQNIMMVIISLGKLRQFLMSRKLQKH